ncbi:MAG: hypothetical protein GC136_00115 [Alphaproteobacteria bacterium]|nr:hypothetical protein [Alphaproteobacteria bacterium]
MALTDIGLCARALVRLGAKPITSFDDGTTESDIAGILYAQARDALLSSYGWSFATAQAALNKLSEAPEADYDCAFQLPADYLRVLSAGSGGRGRGLHYRLYRDQLHANASDVTLTYIYAPDEETFPPYFDAALIARLVAEFCIPLTENTGRAEALIKIADQEYMKARQIDAQQDSPGRIEDFSLINVR